MWGANKHCRKVCPYMNTAGLNWIVWRTELNCLKDRIESTTEGLNCLSTKWLIWKKFVRHSMNRSREVNTKSGKMAEPGLRISFPLLREIFEVSFRARYRHIRSEGAKKLIKLHDIWGAKKLLDFRGSKPWKSESFYVIIQLNRVMVSHPCQQASIRLYS